MRSRLRRRRPGSGPAAGAGPGDEVPPPPRGHKTAELCRRLGDLARRAPIISSKVLHKQCGYIRWSGPSRLVAAQGHRKTLGSVGGPSKTLRDRCLDLRGCRTGAGCRRRYCALCSSDVVRRRLGKPDSGSRSSVASDEPDTAVPNLAAPAAFNLRPEALAQLRDTK